MSTQNKKLMFSKQSVLLVVAVVFLSACGAAQKQETFRDSDSDSIADAQDRCPTTTPGAPIDADGCSLFKGSIEAVDFAPGDDGLNAESRASLEELVVRLNSYPDVVVQLSGHTDNRGSARDNLELSKRRVMSVVRFLVSNGVKGERLKPFGFGESRPVMSNATEEGRSKNRRIELSVVTQ